MASTLHAPNASRRVGHPSTVRHAPVLAPLAAALALILSPAAHAQSNEELLKELKALKERMSELEKKLMAVPAAPAPAPVAGMTPAQTQELNRVTVKTEALEDARDASGLKLLKIAGYMDPAFIWNKRQNQAGFQFLNRVEDGGYNYDNSYFGSAQIDFQKEMDGGTKWRLTLMPNRGAGTVFNGNSPVSEASVSIPLGDLQTRLIAGQIPDWSGYEYLPANQNKLITHNLLFDFTLPTAYTGAGLELTRGKWIVKSMLANMNASRKTASNKSPVFVYRADYASSEFEGFGFAGVHGKAVNFRAGETDATGALLFPNDAGRDTGLNLFEVDGFFTRGDWTLQGQASIGRQKRAAITADPVTGELRDAAWWGLSGLAAYKFSPRFEGIVRADYLSNRKNGGGLLGFNVADSRNGIGPDAAGDPEVGTKRAALSMGLNYLYDLTTSFRVEYRIDRASLPVFENVKDGSFVRSNQLFGASVLVAF